MSSTRRQHRVAELLQRELAQLIAFEVRDPRLDFVSVTRVEISRDLRHAKVYVSHLGGSDAGPQIVAALQHASGFLRHELGRRTALRYLPELHFYFDEGLIVSQRIDALLEQISQGESASQEQELAGK